MKLFLILSLLVFDSLAFAHGGGPRAPINHLATPMDLASSLTSESPIPVLEPLAH